MNGPPSLRVRPRTNRIISRSCNRLRTGKVAYFERIPGFPGRAARFSLSSQQVDLGWTLRESLCDRTGELNPDEMMLAANSNDEAELEFRFVMNWLAAPIQSPGVNLQTNLWLLGARGGTGKGTLVQVMRSIYGGDLTAVLNTLDIEQGGWSDRLKDKLMIIINELNPTG